MYNLKIRIFDCLGNFFDFFRKNVPAIFFLVIGIFVFIPSLVLLFSVSLLSSIVYVMFYGVKYMCLIGLTMFIKAKSKLFNK
jgi:hypothetical protein